MFTLSIVSVLPCTPLVANLAIVSVHVVIVFSLHWQLGLEPYHAVAIIGFNSPEWMIANMGAMFAG